MKSGIWEFCKKIILRGSHFCAVIVFSYVKCVYLQRNSMKQRHFMLY